MDRDEEVVERFGAHMRGIASIRLAEEPDNDEGLWPESLDLEALTERDPEPPQFIVPGWLPCGYATLFAGHGGVGKSGIALHLALCIAAGLPFFDVPVQRRRALYLSCEDRAAVVHWRLARICTYLGLDLATVRGWLELHERIFARMREESLWSERSKRPVMSKRLPIDCKNGPVAYNLPCRLGR